MSAGAILEAVELTPEELALVSDWAKLSWEGREIVRSVITWLGRPGGRVNVSMFRTCTVCERRLGKNSEVSASRSLCSKHRRKS